MNKNRYKQGGFSEYVWTKKYLREYLDQEMPCGYFSGNYFRRNLFDTIVETVLRCKGFTPFEIAVWITSTDARHFQNQVDRKTTLEEFYAHVLMWDFPNYVKIEGLKDK